MNIRYFPNNGCALTDLKIEFEEFDQPIQQTLKTSNFLNLTEVVNHLNHFFNGNVVLLKCDDDNTVLKFNGTFGTVLITYGSVFNDCIF